MSSRVKLNYILDAVIALAFLISAASGILLWLAGSGGYQGGSNPAFQTVVLSISRWAWSDLHVWTSLIMIAGVLLHQVFHWRWIVAATKRVMRPARPKNQDRRVAAGAGIE